MNPYYFRRNRTCHFHLWALSFCPSPVFIPLIHLYVSVFISSIPFLCFSSSFIYSPIHSFLLFISFFRFCLYFARFISFFCPSVIYIFQSASLSNVVEQHAVIYMFLRALQFAISPNALGQIVSRS